MKKFFFIILSTILFCSCGSNKHFLKRTDGTWISKKKFYKDFDKNFQNAWNQLSDTQRVILNDPNIYYEVVVDTTH